MHPLFVGQLISVAALAAGGAPPAVVDFESVPLGTTFGLPTHSPGDLAFSQNGIDVHVENIIVNGNPLFFQATVGGFADPFFPTTPLTIDNVNMLFDFAGLAFGVTSASVEYQAFGGVNNFAVNGGVPLELLDLANLPTNIAAGINAQVSGGLITLTADPGFFISDFTIGGQELGIDNIIAVPEPATLLLLSLGGLSFLRRSRA
jgi:hypothetical protein